MNATIETSDGSIAGYDLVASSVPEGISFQLIVNDVGDASGVIGISFPVSISLVTQIKLQVEGGNSVLMIQTMSGNSLRIQSPGETIVLKNGTIINGKIYCKVS
jgi:hypothetical protein